MTLDDDELALMLMCAKGYRRGWEQPSVETNSYLLPKINALVERIEQEQEDRRNGDV